MTCIVSTLAFSVLLCIIYLLVLLLGLKVYLALTTLESRVYQVDLANSSVEACNCPVDLDYTQNASCKPRVFDDSCRTSTGEKCALSGCFLVGKERRSVDFLHFVNFLGLYWSYWFVVGLGDAVLAGTFATWYWTLNKSLLSHLTIIESFWRVVP